MRRHKKEVGKHKQCTVPSGRSKPGLQRILQWDRGLLVPNRGTAHPNERGERGQCTEGALNAWRKYLGYFPLWYGNAGQWSATAPQYGYKVTDTPMPYSMVVMPNRAAGFGHVAFVKAIARSSTGVWSLRIFEENYDGTAGAPTGHTRWTNVPFEPSFLYVVAPPL